MDINLATLALQQGKSKKAAYYSVNPITISIFLMVPNLTEESFIAVAKPKWTYLGLPNTSANAYHTGQIGLQAICT